MTNAINNNASDTAENTTNTGVIMANDATETIAIDTQTDLEKGLNGYADGDLSMKEAAALAGLSSTAFRMELARAKVTVTRGRTRTWDVQEKFDAIANGAKAADVAKEIGISTGSLYTAFHKAGLSLSDNSAYTDEHGKRAAALYAEGLSLDAVGSALAAEFEEITGSPVSPTVRAMIVKAGGEIRGPGAAGGGGRTAVVVPDEVVAKVKEMRLAGSNTFDIAVACDLTMGVLNRVLKDAGLVKSRAAAPAPVAEAEVAPEAEVVAEVAPEPEVVAEVADLSTQTVKSLLGLLKDAGVELGKDRTKANLIALCNENKLTA